MQFCKVNVNAYWACLLSLPRRFFVEFGNVQFDYQQSALCIGHCQPFFGLI